MNKEQTEKRINAKLKKLAEKFISDNDDLTKRFVFYTLYDDGTRSVLCAVGGNNESRAMYWDSNGLSSKIDIFIPHSNTVYYGSLEELTKIEVVELLKNMKHLKPLT